MLKRRRTEIETAYTAQFIPNNERITEHSRREHCSAKGHTKFTHGTETCKPDAITNVNNDLPT